jgi:hypothetical protein
MLQLKGQYWSVLTQGCWPPVGKRPCHTCSGLIWVGPMAHLPPWLVMVPLRSQLQWPQNKSTVSLNFKAILISGNCFVSLADLKVPGNITLLFFKWPQTLQPFPNNRKHYSHFQMIANITATSKWSQTLNSHFQDESLRLQPRKLL